MLLFQLHDPFLSFIPSTQIVVIRAPDEDSLPLPTSPVASISPPLPTHLLSVVVYSLSLAVDKLTFDNSPLPDLEAAWHRGGDRGSGRQRGQDGRDEEIESTDTGARISFFAGRLWSDDFVSSAKVFSMSHTTPILL